MRTSPQDPERAKKLSDDERLRRHFLAMLSGCGPEGKLSARELARVTYRARREYGAFSIYVARLIAEDAKSVGWL